MELILSVFLVFICCVAFALGGVSNDHDWTVDCAKVGAHVSGGKAYDCKPRDK